MFGRTALLALVPLFHLLASSVTVEAVDVNDVTGTQLVKMCHTQLDFSLVVDESGSIIKEHWEKLIPFLRKIIESLNLDTSDIRLSLTTFSTPVRSIFTFLDKASYDTKTALQMVDEVYKSRPTSGMTYTGQALNFVRNFVLPLGRKHVPKAVLLITDGDSTDAGVTAQAAAMLRDDGVNVLVVGVGNINISECRGIVGCDARMDCPLFVHTEWGKMIELVNQLMREVCEVISEDAVCKPEWSEWSTCNAGCGQPGRKTRTLLSMETIKHATVGSNGQQGRTCKEQEDELISNSESCIGSCDDVNSHNYDTRPPEIGLSKPSDGSPNTPFHDANDRGRNEILGNGSSDGTPDGARYDSSSYPSDGNGSGNNGDSESSGGSGNGSGSLDYNAGGSESNYGNGSESSGGSGNGNGSLDYNAGGSESNYGNGSESSGGSGNGNGSLDYNAGGSESNYGNGSESSGGSGNGNGSLDYNAAGSESNYGNGSESSGGSGNGNGSESSGGSGNGNGSLDYNAGGKKSFNRRMNGESNWNYNAAGKRSWNSNASGSESNYGNGSESSGGSGNGSGSWDYNAAGKKSFNRRMNGESNWNYNAAGSESSGGSGNGSGSLDYNAGGSESNYGNGSESSGGSGNGSGSWDYNAAGKKSFNRRMNGESNWNYNAAGKRSWDRSIDGESSWGGTGTGNMNWDYNAGGSGSNGGIPSNTPFSDALATSGNNDSQPDGSPEKLPGRRNYDDPEEYLPNEDGDGRGGKNGDGNDTTDDDKTASTNGESVIGNDSHVASQDSDDKEEDTHDIVKDGDDNIRKPGAREYDDSDEYLDDELGDWLYRKPEEDEQENGNDQGDEGDRSAPRHADDVYANSLLPNGGDEAGKDASGSNSREGVNLRDASGKGASNEYSTTNAEAKADGADESGGSSSGSNGAKIAGGVILGLLLLGAGGGYAAYKYKGSSSTTGNQDYTGADESAAPLSDAETYEVAEFDNNIWGETT